VPTVYPDVLTQTAVDLGLPLDLCETLLQPYNVWKENLAVLEAAFQKVSFHELLDEPIKPVGHELGRFLVNRLSNLRNPRGFNLDMQPTPSSVPNWSS
jgi:hypothetical protein